MDSVRDEIAKNMLYYRKKKGRLNNYFLIFLYFSLAFYVYSVYNIYCKEEL